jgi:GMP synthase-like glutamine amidotransferase
MILLVSVCEEPLHELEFVRPIQQILQKRGYETIIRHYKEIEDADISQSEKIIICGTSLQDNQYLMHLNLFSWIPRIEKPLLGICAGMQLIGLTHGAPLGKATEIGFYEEYFTPLLGLQGNQEVYHLHTHYADFSLLQEFTVLAGEEVPQAVVHSTKPLYGVLFHPEVRNPQLILNFAALSGT